MRHLEPFWSLKGGRQDEVCVVLLFPATLQGHITAAHQTRLLTAWLGCRGRILQGFREAISQDQAQMIDKIAVEQTGQFEVCMSVQMSLLYAHLSNKDWKWNLGKWTKELKMQEAILSILLTVKTNWKQFTTSLYSGDHDGQMTCLTGVLFFNRRLKRNQVSDKNIKLKKFVVPIVQDKCFDRKVYSYKEYLTAGFFHSRLRWRNAWFRHSTVACFGCDAVWITVLGLL